MSNQFAEKQTIDILDINDVYCPARIQKKNSNGTITVTYIGWSNEWDETVRIDSPRICAKMKTVVAKAWVRLSSKFCYWPCLIYIRYSLNGSLKGEEYLRGERRVFLIPYGPEITPHLRPYKHGVWITTSNMTPFNSKLFTVRYNDGITSQFATSFEAAVKECQNDKMSVEYKFRFDNSSLEIEWKVQEQKRVLLKEKLEKDRKEQEEREQRLQAKMLQRVSTAPSSSSLSLKNQSSNNVDITANDLKRKRSEHNTVPESSKFHAAYNMFKTNIASLPPSAVDSIQNVIKMVSGNGASNTKNKSSASSVSASNVQNGLPMFPFKMSDYCKSIKQQQDMIQMSERNRSTLSPSTSTDSNNNSISVNGNGNTSSSIIINTSRKKGRKNGLNRGRIHSRKQLCPNHIEIKRSQSYLSNERIKRSLTKI